MSVNNLVYLAFGDKTYLLEARYSILSALSFLRDYNELRITIFTDKPDYFLDLPVETSSISTVELDLLKGPFNYFARPKLVLLRKILEQSQGKVIFVDTDTYFIKSPLELFTAISDSVFVLHKNEGDLFINHQVFANRLKEKFPTLKVSGTSSGSVDLVPGNCPYWNSGVIGLSIERLTSLDRTLNIIDSLDPACFGPTIEQLFLGLVFHNEGVITPAEDFVIHYWDKWTSGGYSLREWTHQEIGRIFGMIQDKDLVSTLAVIRKEKIKPIPSSFLKTILSLLKSLTKK